jgi:hypothetical protein
VPIDANEDMIGLRRKYHFDNAIFAGSGTHFMGSKFSTSSETFFNGAQFIATGETNFTGVDFGAVDFHGVDLSRTDVQFNAHTELGATSNFEEVILAAESAPPGWLLGKRSIVINPAFDPNAGFDSPAFADDEFYEDHYDFSHARKKTLWCIPTGKTWQAIEADRRDLSNHKQQIEKVLNTLDELRKRELHPANCLEFFEAWRHGALSATHQL